MRKLTSTELQHVYGGGGSGGNGNNCNGNNGSNGNHGNGNNGNGGTNCNNGTQSKSVSTGCEPPPPPCGY
jgi:hypothetical protein